MCFGRWEPDRPQLLTQPISSLPFSLAKGLGGTSRLGTTSANQPLGSDHALRSARRRVVARPERQMHVHAMVIRKLTELTNCLNFLRMVGS